MLFRFDALPESQKILWPSLDKVSNLGFVLYGGTAAALRFGHRKSVDFDFFSSESFDERRLIDLFPWLGKCRKLQEAENTYSYVTEYSARISFLGGFDFGRIGYPDMDMDTGIQIASPEDIFSLKLRAVADRVALKDFIDVAEFIRRGYSLEHAIIGARTMIKDMLPPEFIIKTLMWYEDPEFDALSQNDRDVIAKACSGIDFQEIMNSSLPISSNTLQDEKLLQIFRNQHPDLLDF